MKEMTSRERLLAAVRFQGPDRVPVSPRMWRYMLRHGGSQGIHAYLKYAEEFGVDPLLQAAAGPVINFPQPGSDYSCLPPTIRVEESVRAETDDAAEHRLRGARRGHGRRDSRGRIHNRDKRLDRGGDAAGKLPRLLPGCAEARGAEGWLTGLQRLPGGGTPLRGRLSGGR